MRPALIGVDWGTTNLRAWALSDDGTILASTETPKGIRALSSDDFVPVLRETIGGWTEGDIPILLGGMVGSRQGWREVNYVECPARPEALAAASLTIETGLGLGYIVPGVVYRDPAGGIDVMRGEEVQLCGLAPATGLVVLPGTHSKWAWLEDGATVSFRTFMTGELYALLKDHSILRHFIAPGKSDLAAFDSGVARAQADRAIHALLFGVRTEALFDRIPPESLGDYLSGLLIGAETAAIEIDARPKLTIVATSSLATRYARAAALRGFGDIEIMDGTTAAVQGLLRIGKLIPEIGLNDAG